MSKLNLDLNSKKAQRLVVAVGLLLAAAIIWTQVKPKWTAAADAKKQGQAQLAQVQTMNADLARLKKQPKGKPPRSRRTPSGPPLSYQLSLALPKDFNQLAEFDRLDRLARITGVKLGPFQPGTPAEQDGARYISLPLTVTGSVPNLLRFTGGLHGMARMRGSRYVDARGPIWKIYSFTLTPGGGQSTITLAGGFYVRAAASAGAAAPGTTAPAQPGTATTPPAP